MTKLLPLFPLEVVLLPGTSLPLHIFEPRYKEMIAECLDRKQPFGVVRSKESEIAEIGCTAEITAVIKKYEDGRMDIATEGRQRFEVMQLNQERAFLQAEVFYIQDEPGRPTTEEETQALKLHSEIIILAGAEPMQFSDTGEQPLSFRLAGSLPLDLDFKQNLLGTKSEAERLQAVISFFEAILPTLRRTAHVRRKAGGNGFAG